MFPRTAVPTFLVDITEFEAQKHRAILCYRSQLYDPNSTEPETNLSTEAFLRRVEARQRFYGSLIAVEHAEGFIVREALNVHDPIELLSRRMNMYYEHWHNLLSIMRRERRGRRRAGFGAAKRGHSIHFVSYAPPMRLDGGPARERIHFHAVDM
jgi:hypothetical protein